MPLLLRRKSSTQGVSGEAYSQITFSLRLVDKMVQPQFACFGSHVSTFIYFSTAYDCCNDIIKDFVCSLDEGAVITHRRIHVDGAAKLSSLGIPLTVDILVEIICFGFYSSNKKVSRYKLV